MAWLYLPSRRYINLGIAFEVRERPEIAADTGMRRAVKVMWPHNEGGEPFFFDDDADCIIAAVAGQHEEAADACRD